MQEMRAEVTTKLAVAGTRDKTTPKYGIPDGFVEFQEMYAQLHLLQRTETRR